MNPIFERKVRCLITRGDATADNFHSKKDEIVETVRLAAAAGLELVQIREKKLPGKSLYELTVEAVAATRDSSTKTLINERFDIALAAGAHGVHLPSTSIPVAAVRKNVPNGFIVGVSAHSLSDVKNACDARAAYAMFGPIFATPGKAEPKGIEELSRICAAVAPFPVIAVGGIDGSNQESVIHAGVAGFAAIRYLNEFVKIGQ